MKSILENSHPVQPLSSVKWFHVRNTKGILKLLSHRSLTPMFGFMNEGWDGTGDVALQNNSSFFDADSCSNPQSASSSAHKNHLLSFQTYQGLCPRTDSGLIVLGDPGFNVF